MCDLGLVVTDGHDFVSDEARDDVLGVAVPSSIHPQILRKR
jgi:hypothetical protein